MNDNYSSEFTDSDRFETELMSLPDDIFRNMISILSLK